VEGFDGGGESFIEADLRPDPYPTPDHHEGVVSIEGLGEEEFNPPASLITDGGFVSEDPGFDDAGVVEKDMEVCREMVEEMVEGGVGHGIGGTVVHQQSGTVSRACRGGGDVPFGEMIVVALGQQLGGGGHGLCIGFGLVEIVKILIPEVEVLIVYIAVIGKRFIGLVGCTGFGGCFR